LIESHVTERQDEETRGTGDSDVHHVHTGGARLAARRIIAAVSMGYALATIYRRLPIYTYYKVM